MQIRYRVRPEEVDDNCEAVRAFMAELGRDPDDGFVYESFQLPDEASFVHMAWFADEAAKTRFQGTPHFQAFANGLKARVVSPPEVTPVILVGSTNPRGG